MVITDIQMPLMDGMAATREIKEKFPFTYVIACSGFDDDSLIAAVMQAGASGYLLKDGDTEEILIAIYKVLKGEVYYNHYISNKMMKLMNRTSYNPLKPFGKPSLTQKETAVMKLTAEGYSCKEVGAKLNMELRNVENIKERIISKTGCRSSAGMGLCGIRNNIIKQ